MSGTYKWPVFDQHDLIHPTRGQRIAESVLLDPTRKFYDESRSFKVKGSDNSTAPQPTYFQSEFELRMDASSTSKDETLKDLFLAFPGEPRNRGVINAPEIPSRRKQFVTSTGDFMYGYQPKPFVNNAFSYGSDIHHIGNNYPPTPAPNMYRNPMFEPPPPSLHRGVPSLPTNRPKYVRESKPDVPPKLEPSSVADSTAEMDEKVIDGYTFYDTPTLEPNQIVEPNEQKNAPDGNPSTEFVTDTDNPTPKARSFSWYQRWIEPIVGRRAVEIVPSHESMIISPSLPEEKITAEAYKAVHQSKEAELREEITRLTRELSQVQENTMNPEEAAAEIQQEIVKVQSRLDAVIQEKEHLRSLVDTQAQTLDALDRTIKNMEDSLKQKESNIQSLQNELRQAQGYQQEQLKTTLEQQKEETEKLRQDLLTIQEELGKEKEKVVLSTQSTAQLQLDLLTTRKDAEALREALSERNVENTQLSTEKLRLTTKLAAAEANLVQAEANLQAATNKLTTGSVVTAEQSEQLRQEVEYKEEMLIHLRDVIDNLQNELEKVRDEEEKKRADALQQQKTQLQNSFNQQLLHQEAGMTEKVSTSVQSALQSAAEAQKQYSLSQLQLENVRNDLEQNQQMLRQVVKSVFGWNDTQFDQQWTTSSENVYALLQNGVNNMEIQISARQQQQMIDNMISEISDRVGQEKNELKQIYQNSPDKFFQHIVKRIQQDHESRIMPAVESKTLAEKQKMIANYKKTLEQETAKLKRMIERKDSTILSNERTITSTLQDLAKTKQEYQTEIQTLQNELRKTSSEKDSHLTSLRNELDQSKLQLQELQKTLTSLQSELQTSRGQNTTDRSTYESKIREYKQIYNKLVQESEQKEKELNSQVQQYAQGKESETEDLRAQLRAAVQNIGILEENERVLKLQANEVIQHLLDQYATLATNNSAIMTELHIEQNTSDTLLTTVEELRKKKELLNIDLASFQEQYKKDATTAKQYIGGMQKQIQELSTENDQLKGMIQNIQESAEARNNVMMIKASPAQNQDSSLTTLSAVTTYSSQLDQARSLKRVRKEVDTYYTQPQLPPPENTGPVFHFDEHSPSQGVVALLQPNPFTGYDNQAMAIYAPPPISNNGRIISISDEQKMIENQSGQVGQGFSYEEKQVEHSRGLRQQGINNSVLMQLQKFAKIPTFNTRVNQDLRLLNENTKVERLQDAMTEVMTPGAMDVTRLRSGKNVPNAVRNVDAEGQKNLGMTVYKYVEEVKELRKLAKQVKDMFGNYTEAQVERGIEQQGQIDFTDAELSAATPPPKKNAQKEYVEKVWVFRKWQKDQSRFLSAFEDDLLKTPAEQRIESQNALHEVLSRLRSEKLGVVVQKMGLVPDNRTITGYRIGAA